MSELDPASILYEDAHFVVVNKPAGLLTQGVPGQGPTLEDAIREYLAPDDPRGVYLGTVHRLDRPVSGVIVWAKTVKIARRLSASFEQRYVKKTYWAIVEGWPEGPARWVDRLTRVHVTGKAEVVAEGTDGARVAITRMTALRQVSCPKGTSAILLEPETGRTHQLRAQTSAHGVPIVGDDRYGALRKFAGGIALHARELRFSHPITRQEMGFVAPIPTSWLEFGVELS
jgi:23S rRNA pseudouridine1911/1915/1917 synthase